MADSIGQLFIELLPDVDKKKFQAALDASTKTVNAKIDVNLKVTQSTVRKAVADVNRRLRQSKSSFPKIEVGLKVTQRSVRSAIREANAHIKAAKTAMPTINVKLNLTDEQLKLAREIHTDVAQIETVVNRRPIRLDVELDKKAQASLLSKIELLQERARLKAASDSIKFARAEELVRTRSALRIDEIEKRASVARSSRSSNSLRLLRNDLSNFEFTTTRTLRRLGLGFSLMTGAVVGSFAAISAAALKSFAETEVQIQRTAAVLGTDAFQTAAADGRDAWAAFNNEIEQTGPKLQGVINQTALATIFDPTEIASGTRALAQAGLKIGDIQASLESVAKFAQNEEILPEEAVQNLVQGAVAAGHSLEDIEGLANRFTIVANDTTASATEVAEAFANRAAPSFRAYGESIDSTLTVLDLFARAGIKGKTAGEQAGILIREINKAAKKTPETEAAFKRYGIEVGKVNGKQVPFLKTLSQLSNVLESVRKKKGSGGLAEVRKELGLTEKSGNGLIQTLSQVSKLGESGLFNLEARIRESRGALDRQAEIITNTLSFQFDRFTNQIGLLFKVAAGPTGKAFTGILKDFNDQMEAGSGSAGRLSSRIGQIGESIKNRVEPVLRSIFFGRQGPDFFSGLAAMYSKTLSALSKGFIAFRSAAFGPNDDRGFFTVLGDGLEAFGDLALRVFPRIGSLLGKITKFIMENKAQAEGLARAWLTIFVGSKTLSLFVIPAIDGFDRLAKVGKVFVGLNLAKSVSDTAVSMDKLAKSTAAVSAASSAGGAAGAGGGRLASLKGSAKSASILTAAVLAGGYALKGFAEGASSVAEENPRLKTSIEAVIPSAENLGKALKFIADIAFRPFENVGNQVGKSTAQAIVAIDSFIQYSKSAANDLSDAWGQWSLDISSGAGVTNSLDRLTSNTLRAFRTLDGKRVVANNLSTSLNVLKSSTESLIDAEFKSRARANESSVAFELLKHRLDEATGSTIASTMAQDDYASALNTALSSAYLYSDPAMVVEKTVDGSAKAFDDAAAAVNNYSNEIRNATREALRFRLQEEAIAQLRAAGRDIDSAAQLSPQTLLDIETRVLDATNPFIIEGKRKAQIESRKKALKTNFDEIDRIISNSTGGVSSSASKAASAIKEIKTAAEIAAEAVGKLSQKQLDAKAGALIPKVIRSAAHGYKATAFEAEVLKRVLPSLESQLQKQTDAVSKLDKALQDLQATQLKGTKKFTDEAFALDQSVKQLQLQRLDLIIAGTPEEDTAIKSLDEQIASIQRQAERSNLVQSLQLDPLKKKLEETFNPVVELGFDQIVKRFEEINAKKAPLEKAIAGGENLKAMLEATIADAEARFTDAGANVSLGLIKGVQSKTTQVTASGKQSGDALLTGLNSVMNFGSPSKTMITRGQWAAEGFAQGVNANNAMVMQAGVSTMFGFLTGMKNVYENRVQPFVTGIAKWIKDNKGPVSYDRTLLRPAGSAMMEGFQKGLSDGFAEVKSWVKSVGPDLAKHTIPDSIFKEMSAEFLIGNASADLAFDPDKFFESVNPLTGFLGYGYGGLGQSTGLQDTINQAKIIAQMFGIVPNIGSELRRYNNPAYNAAIGGAAGSLHVAGRAMDFTGPEGSLDAASAWAKKLLGKSFAEVLWKTTGHYDHLHIGWIYGIEKLMADIAGASRTVEDALSQAANKTNVDFNFLAAIAKAESGFNPFAGSPAGARGLMQLMPATASGLGVTNILDPYQNALGGAKYIKNMLEMFGGNKRLALAGYNAGPGNARIALTSFSETMAYVERVLRYFKNFSTGNYRAMGGKVNANTPYMVGERGMEMFIPQQNGSVISNKDIKDLILSMKGNSSAGSNSTVNDNRTINVHSNATDPALVASIINSHMGMQIRGVKR